MLSLPLVLLLFRQFSPAIGFNILGICPSASYSHQQPFQALMKALAARGHNVTMISTIPSKVSAIFPFLLSLFSFSLFIPRVILHSLVFRRHHLIDLSPSIFSILLSRSLSIRVNGEILTVTELQTVLTIIGKLHGNLRAIQSR